MLESQQLKKRTPSSYSKKVTSCLSSSHATSRRPTDSLWDMVFSLIQSYRFQSVFIKCLLCAEGQGMELGKEQ